ncbi:MAG: zinc-ribbon and DUF3426 domain-containing protein [Pseudomonadales bacterium]
MKTYCPNCRTSFPVTEEQLNMADGLVRCGVCDEVFHAREDMQMPSVQSSGRSSDRSSNRLSDSVPPEEGAKEPKPKEWLPKRRRAASPWYLPMAVALGLVAAAQYFYFNMPSLSQQVSYRHHYITLCELVPCKVPDFRDAASLTTRELTVRPHPSMDNVLQLDLLLQNTAPFRQKFPQLQLEFTDADGRLVANRRFKVREYLDGELRGLKYIPANTEVWVSLELINPGAHALGYQIKVIPS